jgi:hypothetical protein
MKKLLSDLAAEKTAYQAYSIEHGIERIKIQIPLKEARSFEVAFNASIADGSDSKANLLAIVSAHGGSVRVKTKN